MYAAVTRLRGSHPDFVRNMTFTLGGVDVSIDAGFSKPCLAMHAATLALLAVPEGLFRSLQPELRATVTALRSREVSEVLQGELGILKQQLWGEGQAWEEEEGQCNLKK
jgi:hypothetical protein